MSRPLPDSASTLLLALLAGLAGLLIGSFLNVCIYRIPRDLSVVFPRSSCPECNAAIPFYDNLPLLSFAVLRGRCRHCHARISLQYPAVEAMTALLFAWIAFRYGVAAVTLKWLLFEALLVVLFWTDLEVRILPDEITLGGSVAAVLFAVWIPMPGLFGDIIASTSGAGPVAASLLNLAAGALFLAGPLWLAGAVYGKLRKRDALGFGDVKLLVLIGSFLGLQSGLLALTVGAVAGAVIGAAWALLARRSLADFELPFGSFLCAAAALVPLLTGFGSH